MSLDRKKEKRLSIVAAQVKSFGTHSDNHCVFTAYTQRIHCLYAMNISVNIPGNLLCEVLCEHFPFVHIKGKMFTKNFTEKVHSDIHREFVAYTQ